MNENKENYKNYNNDDNDTDSDIKVSSGMKKILNGFIENVENKKDLNFKQILVISHGGWISEFFSLIRRYKNLSNDNSFKYLNTSISLVRIYCSNCLGYCKEKSQSELCRINIDIVFENNTAHLE